MRVTENSRRCGCGRAIILEDRDQCWLCWGAVRISLTCKCGKEHTVRQDSAKLRTGDELCQSCTSEKTWAIKNGGPPAYKRETEYLGKGKPELEGLDKPEPIFRQCNKCDRWFTSEDRKRFHFCPSCRGSNIHEASGIMEHEFGGARRGY